MLKKILLISLIVLNVGVVYAEENNDDSSFHAQMRTIPYDTAKGKRTVVTFAGVQSENTSGRYVGTYTDLVRLSIHGKLNDVVSVQIEPSFRAPVKANPVFGADIGAQIANASLFTQQDFETAKVIIKLQDGYTLSTGLMRAKLSWDYGDFMAEKTSLVESRFSVSNNGVINDAGVEVKKSFNIMGTQVPMIVQMLNGANPYVDTNQNVAFLVGAEPVVNGVKYHAAVFNSQTASLNADVRYSVGAEYSAGPLYIRSEYVGGFQKLALTEKNATTNATKWTARTKKSNGYYAVAKYAVLSNVNLLGQYSYLELNNLDGIAYGSDAKESDSDLALSVEYLVDTNFAITTSYIKSKYSRKDSAAKTGTNREETLDFSRLVVGSRLAF